MANKIAKKLCLFILTSLPSSGVLAFEELIDQAVYHCQIGNFEEGRERLVFLRDTLSPPAQVVANINHILEKQCMPREINNAIVWHNQLSISAGYQHNVNQGPASGTLYLNGQLIEGQVELTDDLLQKGSAFTNFRFQSFHQPSGIYISYHKLDYLAKSKYNTQIFDVFSPLYKKLSLRALAYQRQDNLQLQQLQLDYEVANNGLLYLQKQFSNQAAYRQTHYGMLWSHAASSQTNSQHLLQLQLELSQPETMETPGGNHATSAIVYKYTKQFNAFQFTGLLSGTYRQTHEAYSLTLFNEPLNQIRFFSRVGLDYRYSAKLSVAGYADFQKNVSNFDLFEYDDYKTGIELRYRF